MQFPKLTPLQSRFAACLGTSLVLLIIYFSLNPSQFAYAAELDSILNEDHNHHRIHAQQLDLDWGGVSHQLLEDEEEEGLPAYQAAFGVGLPPNLVGRQALDTVRLKNNMPNTLNLVPGETQWYVFEASELRAAPGGRGVQLPTNVTGQDATLKRRKDRRSLELAENGEILEKRQNSSARTVYLSANTCLQPALNENKTGTPGQPTIYISRSNTNQKPDADTNDGFQQLDQGYASLALQEVEDSIFISITAPQLPNDTFTGPWSYQIAASTDDYYHYYNNETAFMWTVDTDSTSALLATYNLTDQNGNLTSVQQQRQAWMDMTNDPPFDIYVFNSSSPKIDGIKNSYCGLSKLNMDFMRINSSISERGVGKNPKQQFYMQSLVAGNTYFSVLAYKGANSSDENAATVGGGGQVWKSMQFSTKADGNCRVIFDLPFCDSVAYAVPTNPSNDSLTNASTLASIYDAHAQSLYTNFARSLQQIPCNTTSTAQYSLTSTCDDCARDYKTWLCAVTIPRCVDFSSRDPFLAPRNIGSPFPNGTVLDLPSLANLGNLPLAIENTTQLPANSSRNPLIDSDIQPGPYKELLPCQQICWDMVKSCPMSLGLRCPEAGALYGRLGRSYGSFDPGRIMGTDGILNISGLSCNYLGVDWPTLGNGAASLGIGSWAWMVVALVGVWTAL